jgi:uncharacterized damage-inducible protein DinB
MFNPDSLRDILRYNDWANDRLLHAAVEFSDTQLDQPFDVGLGSLRRILTHLYTGEHVWLQRWQGKQETPWPDEKEKVSIADLSKRFAQVRSEREAFISKLSDAALANEVTYRDSKGSLFKATLSDMLNQGIFHSAHHRAQLANLIRRTNGTIVDLDYMYWARKPA